jgi:hypothetical protein
MDIAKTAPIGVFAIFRGFAITPIEVSSQLTGPLSPKSTSHPYALTTRLTINGATTIANRTGRHLERVRARK